MNGPQVRMLREALRISLPTFANSVGMSPTSVSLFERDQLKITPEQEINACQALTEAASEASLGLAALRYMETHKCELAIGVDDAGQCEWEVTPTTLNPAFSGYGLTISEAALDAMKQNRAWSLA